MSEVTGGDIERLANRMAMLVSDDGEADNAGRAVGQLARQLGLTGGDLKQIVMSGAGAAPRPGTAVVPVRLEQEIATLRRELRQAEEAAIAARKDREALLAESAALRVAMYRSRAAAKLRRMMAGLAVIFMGVVAMALVWFGPNLFDSPPPRLNLAQVAPRMETPGSRVALVRTSGAIVYREPDRGAEPLGRLAPGSKLVVLRTEWRSMMQWAQVELDGRLGYVATTEIDLF